MVIPITESMKDPHKFPRVLTGVMVGAMILFAGGGVLAYAAYGSAIQVCSSYLFQAMDHAKLTYCILLALDRRIRQPPPRRPFR